MQAELQRLLLLICRREGPNMTDNKKPSFWQNLTSREQILIFIMLAMAITVGGYYGILRPIHDYQTSGKQRYIAAADDAVMIDKAINMRGATASVRQGKAAQTRNKQPVSADEFAVSLSPDSKGKRHFNSAHAK